MIAIVEYGVGNVFSLSCSLDKIGAEAIITSDKAVLQKADRIILPGVGAFGDAAKKLEESGLSDYIAEAAGNGKPILGICVGMQLLFEKSYEYGEHKGLGLIKGTIHPIAESVPSNYKVPHMGWNALQIKKPSELFKYINNGDYVYFVHSYYAAECDDSVTAITEYGAPITASVENGNVYGCQFHPEISGETGLNVLKAFRQL